MAITIGDPLLMSQSGIEQKVEAVSGPNEGLVQIKNKGTFSPCPVGDLSEPWVLTDPDGQGLDTGEPIYVAPDGQTTEDPKEAKWFKNEDDAEEFRDDHTGIPYFVPKRVKDCLTD